MHETRNFLLILALVAAAAWAVVAWIILSPEATMLGVQRIAAPLLLLLIAGRLGYALCCEDRLDDLLAREVGAVYYEADGVSFLPTIRQHGRRAELCVYYQNRHENPAQMVVHLRLMEHGYLIRPGCTDVHLAFRVGGGDFGVVRQPIAVPRDLQGQIVHIELAAATHYPRSHGACWRRKGGLPVGNLQVDWGGAAFRTGIHEVSGEIQLTDPIIMHLTLPEGAASEATKTSDWRQECVSVGVTTA